VHYRCNPQCCWDQKCDQMHEAQAQGVRICPCPPLPGPAEIHPPREQQAWRLPRQVLRRHPRAIHKIQTVQDLCRGDIQIKSLPQAQNHYVCQCPLLPGPAEAHLQHDHRPGNFHDRYSDVIYGPDYRLYNGCTEKELRIRAHAQTHEARHSVSASASARHCQAPRDHDI